jgi:hypothetical protein
MRKLLSLAVALSICSFGFVGCKPKDEVKKTTTEKVTTPTGSEEKTTETTDTKKGDAAK